MRLPWFMRSLPKDDLRSPFVAAGMTAAADCSFIERKDWWAPLRKYVEGVVDRKIAEALSKRV